jgi:hypothetical protein
LAPPSLLIALLCNKPQKRLTLLQQLPFRQSIPSLHLVVPPLLAARVHPRLPWLMALRLLAVELTAPPTKVDRPFHLEPSLEMAIRPAACPISHALSL